MSFKNIFSKTNAKKRNLSSFEESFEDLTTKRCEDGSLSEKLLSNSQNEGTPDTFGKILRVTATAIADELCSAAELVMGKTKKCPAAIIKNFEFKENTGNIQSILRSEKEDLFR